MLVHTLRYDKSLKPGDVLLLAVSGGADSLVLLHALAQTREQHGLQLHVATLNHGIRAAAKDDVLFVQQMAEALQIPCTVGEAHAVMTAKAGNMGVEAAARLVRYKFLAKTAQAVGALTMATAHHANDQAETVLMHILRGTGLRGLQGMSYSAPLPYDPDLRLIRPLLPVTRTQIDAYCAEHDLQPRHDETNDDTTLLRNKIRHEILPVLAKINPQISPALGRLAEVVQVEQDFIQRQFEREVLPHVQAEDDGSWHPIQGERVCLPIPVFQALHTVLQRQFVAWAVQKAAPPTHFGGEISHERILAACRAAMTGRVGTIIDFPETVIHMRITYSNLVFEVAPTQAQRQSKKPFDSVLIPVVVPGTTTLRSGSNLHVTLEPHENFQARLAIPTGTNLALRTRKQGDRFKPLGMQGKTRKLKDWFIDRKISQSERDTIPLLVINEDIAAIILAEGWFISEAYAVRPESANVIYCSIIANALDRP